MSRWNAGAIATDWTVQSPSSDGVSVQTPLVHIGIEAGEIRVPIQRRTGTTIEQAIVKGYGLGLGMGAGLDLGPINFSDSPKNLPETKDSTPGTGTRIFAMPQAPRPFQAKDFEGILVACTLSHTDMAVQGSGVALLFCLESTLFRLERTMMETVSPLAGLVMAPPVRAFGFAAGVGAQSALVSLGASYIKYTVKLE